jgi:Ca2+-binding RTX toxin-like protein
MANINGSNGGDTLNDTAGSDVITALGGNDTIVISLGGTDDVDGGDDTDRLVLDARVTGGGITMGAPTAGADGLSGSASWTGTAVTFQRIENFTIHSSTGSFSDNVTTGSGDDVFYHYGVNDQNYPADTIDLGGGANDLLVADFSAVTGFSVVGYLNFTPGHNLLTLNSVTKIDYTNVERLWLIGGALNDNVRGLAGDDILEGRGGADLLRGEAGNDRLDGGQGNDTLDGGADDDTFVITIGSDQVIGGTGSDTLIVDYGDATTGLATNGPVSNATDGGYDGRLTINASRFVDYTSIERYDITTGSGGDTINTGAGNDIVRAGDGDDFVNVLSGLDTADGGSGIDRITADLSAAMTAIAWDLVAGTYSGPAGTSFTNFEFFGEVATGAGNDTIVTADLQKDEGIYTSGGDDSVTVRNGRDTVFAGAGTDTLVVNYGNATTAITSGNLSAVAGTIPADAAGGYEGYIGDLTNRFVMFHGIEKLVVTTGSANDVIQLPNGANVTDDIVSLGGGDDVTALGRGVDVADGGAGTDGLDADQSQVSVAISIDLNLNTYSGVAGTSFTNFEYFADRDNGFRTGTGNDNVITRNANLNDSVRLGAGNDSVTVYNGTDFVVGYGLDTPAGQGGTDTLVVDYSAAATAITTDGGFLQTQAEGWDGRLTDGAGGTRFTTFYGFDRFDITTGSGNDVLNYFNLNTSADNVFHLGAGNDSVNLSQSTGNNYIDGGTGNDTMTGGFGNDTYVVDSASDVINDFFGGTDEVRTTLAAYTLATDLENLTGTSNAGQTLRGNGGANVVSGAGGNDMINLSDGGNDTGNGGGGDDGFFFGAAFTAADRVDGGAGTNDQIALQGNYTGGNALTLGSSSITGVEAIVLLAGFSYQITSNDSNVAAGQVLKVQATQLAAGQGLTFNGSAETNGSFLLYGGQGNDNFTGGAGNDGFYFGPGGFNGSDVVNGGAGTNDQLGLDGNYSMTLGGNLTGIEVVVLLHGPSGTPNTFNLTAANSLVAAGQTMTIFGLQVETGITFNGAAETDGTLRIYGGTGNDVLTGGGGNDWIFGGDRGDTLTGGAGNDTFYYDSLTQSNSTERDGIQDFALGDIIDLSGIDANANTVGDDAFTWLGSGAFTNQAGQLRIENISLGGPIYLIQGDVDGNGVSDFEVVFVNADAHTITAADFTF